jgi:hypothetical protein
MKTMLVAAAAMTLAVAANAAPAFADGPRASSSNSVTRVAAAQSGNRAVGSHYEWQYHYVGHHARLEGYWALVRDN